MASNEQRRSVITAGLALAGLVLALFVLASCDGTGRDTGSSSGGVAIAGTLALFAGNLGGAGNADGTASAATFNGPAGVATDSSGNVYLADAGNGTIRKITSAGVVTTFAGTAGVIGSADGTGPAASFNQPTALAVDNAGNVYVADLGNNTIRKITPTAVVSTLAGTAGVSGSSDGTGPAASFNLPEGLAIDGNNNVYVSDTANDTIRKITPAGAVSTLAGTAGASGTVDGTGPAARFNFPTGVAIDSGGVLYVADQGDDTIRTVTLTGVVQTLAGMAGTSGSADGNGTAARFSRPFGVAVDRNGNIFVADNNNNTLRKVLTTGDVSTVAGTAGVVGSSNGSGAAASFKSPLGLAADGSGNVYVADQGNNTVREVTPAGLVSTLAGLAAVTGSGDGNGAAASFNLPIGVAVDAKGNVYVADSANSTIRLITKTGVVSTLAGTAGSTGSTDGIGASARFDRPAGVAVDSTGNVFVVDQGNNTIRKITPTGVVSTLAGVAGLVGSADGNTTAARFSSPYGIAIDSAGLIYVADTGNNTIRRITPLGVVSTLAGAAGVVGSTDGTGFSASFSGPHGLAADSAGNVFVADSGNNTIRKITPAAVVSTFAGQAGAGGSLDGTGAAASFSFPAGVTIDSSNNISVADSGNFTIRRITSGAVVSTVVGVAGQQGFAPGPLPAGLQAPAGLAASGASLYVTAGSGVALVQFGP